MSSNSQTLLSANTHPGDSTSVTVHSSHFKGDGYYGRSDGLHTVQYDYTGFRGEMKIEATLATTPTDADWFQVFMGVMLVSAVLVNGTFKKRYTDG